jgi:hypothetical protein
MNINKGGIMKFRKKPIVVEAIQYIQKPSDVALDQAQDRVCDFVGKNLTVIGGSHIEIETLEGTMLASPNDWIIKGVNGEFYPCKPDIFEKTYEVIKNILVFEVVTIGIRGYGKFIDRNNANYSIVRVSEGDPIPRVGTKWQSGAYDIETIYVKEITSEVAKYYDGEVGDLYQVAHEDEKSQSLNSLADYEDHMRGDNDE